MSLKTKLVHIDKPATIKCGDLTIDVILRDFKQSYGNDRWLVEPVAGSGRAWVETIFPKHATRKRR